MTRKPAIPGTDTRETHVGSEYTDEQREFLTALAAYKQAHQKPFLSMCEVLEIARSIGYAKKTPNDYSATMTTMTTVTAFSDAFACLCLVQQIAAGKEPPKWRLEHIEIEVALTVASLRLRQEEIERCTR